MTELEKALKIIINIFNSYATFVGEKKTLTKGEMKTLIQKELPSMIEGAKDKKALEELMKDLDENSTSAVDFNEFIRLVVKVGIFG